MAERVLANDLSGLEVRNAILDKISRSLERDCHLSQDHAYQFFECSVSISLKVHDVGRTENIEVAETVAEGSRPEDAALEAADAAFEIAKQSPNEVRVETGQDVPVLTRDPNGKPAIKGIKYSRKQLEKAGR